jgi:hypothetical protein
MLLGGQTGDIERAARLGGRIRELLTASALLAAPGVALAATGHANAAAAVLAGALAGVSGAAIARSERRRELFRLVAAGRTAEPEVCAFANELVGPTRRRRLAEGLRRAARAGEPGLQELTHIRPERAHALHAQLLELAAAFADQSRALRPESAALCRRLLCEPMVSPLYNTKLPLEELERALEQIRSGISD